MKPWAKRPFSFFLLLLVPLRAFFHSLLTPITLFSGGKQYIVLHMEALEDILAAREGGINLKGGGVVAWLFFFRPSITPFLDMPFLTIQWFSPGFTWQLPIWPLIFYGCDLPTAALRQPCNWQCYEEEKAAFLDKHNFFGSWHHSFNEIKYMYTMHCP